MNLQIGVLSIFLIALKANALLSPLTIYCEKIEARGIPVLTLKIQDKTVIEAREILQSLLTGELRKDLKLNALYSSESGIFRFDLGQRYTEDLSVRVDLNQTPLKVTSESYDRDDGTERSEALACH